MIRTKTNLSFLQAVATYEILMPVGGKYLLPREGKITLLVLLLLTAICWYQFGLIPTCLLLGVSIFAAYFFRLPLTAVPATPLAIISPISGTVIAIENGKDAWLERDVVKLSVKMDILDVHNICSPIEGKVRKIWHNKTTALSGRECSYWIQTDEEDDVLINFCLGFFAPFVKTRFVSGERVGQGHPVGFLYFSGIVEMYMPSNVSIDISVGQKLRLGGDIIARFVHD